MRTTVYLHSSKESMYEKGVSLGIQGDALDMFKYALSEVVVEIEVNEATGIVEIFGIK